MTLPSLFGCTSFCKYWRQFKLVLEALGFDYTPYACMPGSLYQLVQTGHQFSTPYPLIYQLLKLTLVVVSNIFFSTLSFPLQDQTFRGFVPRQDHIMSSFLLFLPPLPTPQVCQSRLEQAEGKSWSTCKDYCQLFTELRNWRACWDFCFSDHHLHMPHSPTTPFLSRDSPEQTSINMGQSFSALGIQQTGFPSHAHYSSRISVKLLNLLSRSPIKGKAPGSYTRSTCE